MRVCWKEDGLGYHEIEGNRKVVRGSSKWPGLNSQVSYLQLLFCFLALYFGSQKEKIENFQTYIYEERINTYNYPGAPVSSIMEQELICFSHFIDDSFFLVDNLL